MDSYEYWNDIATEKNKPYWIVEESDNKLIRFLRQDTNLERCFIDALSFVKNIKGIRGRILDVGAGVGWASAIVSNLSSVDSVVCIDFSEHRLKKIAPVIIRQFAGNPDKVNFILGDFLNMDFEPNHFEIVMFVQSLYMFADLGYVLKKTYNLLKDDGILMVICERILEEGSLFSYKFYGRKIRETLGNKTDISGKYGYTDTDYRKAIKRASYGYKFQLLDYPLFPKISALKAGNHFGIKMKK